MGTVESRSEESETVSDGVLLSQLIQLLHRRPKQSLPLADLKALLPNSLRKRAQDHGGLKMWIQQYHSLFEVVGEINKETVVLNISSSSDRPLQVDSPNSSEPQQEPDPAATPEHPQPISRRQEKQQQDAKNALLFDEDGQGHLAVQLRGLPYKATVEDIRNFLDTHVEHLHEENPIHLILNRDGRPSGFARVLFESQESARLARDELHLRGMEDRYVEVFLYPERPSKGRNRRLEEGEKPAMAEANGMTLDTVVNECRAEMAKPGKRKMLLSMLGVNLSAGARAYLKQMDQGLKHFLAQFASEFQIEGNKGCEFVSYTPSEETLAKMEREEKPLQSPKSKSPNDVPSSVRVPMTPSDWGTPAPGAAAPALQWMPPWPQQGVENGDAWNNWAALQGQMQQWQGGQSWNQYGWSGEENSNVNFGLDPQAIATAVFYGASAAMAAASAAQAGGSYVPPGTAAVPEEDGGAAIRLRGLPYASSEQDVLAFFAQHDVVDRISDVPKAVNILQRANGRPSGQAIVQMRDRSDAELAQRVLNGQWMGQRYIEVFLYDETVETQSQNALAAATAAATAHAKLQSQAGDGSQTAAQSLSLANNLANTSSQAMAGWPGMGGWPGTWGQSSGQMPDGQNPEWQALFSFLGDGQRNGFPGQPGQAVENGDGATTSAAVV